MKKQTSIQNITKKKGKNTLNIYAISCVEHIILLKQCW